MLLGLVAIVLSVIALSKVNDVVIRISLLEKKYKEGGNPTLDLKAPSEVHESQVQHVATQPVPQPVVYHPQPQKESEFWQWLKEDWLLKLGGILVIMGVLFFLSVAYTAVGPQGKIIMGYLFGITLMVFGFWYANKQIVGGGAIHLIGATVVIITTYLAQSSSYNLFNTPVATMLMFLTAACVSLTAYSYERVSLAYASLLIASSVPMLVMTGSSFLTVLVYLSAVLAGVLWLAFITKWRLLVLLSLVVMCFYSFIFALRPTDLQTLEAYMVIAFGVVFFLTSISSILRSKGETGKEDGFVALLNAGYCLIWVFSQVGDEYTSIVTAGMGLVYALGFFLVYKVTNVYTSFLIYGGVAIGLLTTASMLELSGPAETTALLLIAAAVTVFTWYLSNNVNVTKTYAFVNLIPLVGVTLSIMELNVVERRGGSLGSVWEHVFILLLATVLYFLLYGYFKEKIRELSYVALWAGIILTIIAIWQLLHIVIGGGLATFITLLIYTIVGLTILFKALQANSDSVARLAKIWLGLVAARVIFWDAWQSGDIILGVIICIVIGLLLVSSTFILKKVSHA